MSVNCDGRAASALFCSYQAVPRLLAASLNRICCTQRTGIHHGSIGHVAQNSSAFMSLPLTCRAAYDDAGTNRTSLLVMRGFTLSRVRNGQAKNPLHESNCYSQKVAHCIEIRTADRISRNESANAKLDLPRERR